MCTKSFANSKDGINVGFVAQGTHPAAVIAAACRQNAGKPRILMFPPAPPVHWHVHAGRRQLLARAAGAYQVFASSRAEAA
jgi:hypothetical protein